MSDLVGNPEDRFSRVAAHISSLPISVGNFYQNMQEVDLGIQIFNRLFVTIYYRPFKDSGLLRFSMLA